eukprot:Rhum_TRINITY_DN25103_c0_g1::Rhum_TRINITY_DN25103_c0_g1_i1::g.181236::m.181236
MLSKMVRVRRRNTRPVPHGASTPHQGFFFGLLFFCFCLCLKVKVLGGERLSHLLKAEAAGCFLLPEARRVLHRKRLALRVREMRRRVVLQDQLVRALEVVVPEVKCAEVRLHNEQHVLAQGGPEAVQLVETLEVLVGVKRQNEGEGCATLSDAVEGGEDAQVREPWGGKGHQQPGPEAEDAADGEAVDDAEDRGGDDGGHDLVGCLHVVADDLHARRAQVLVSLHGGVQTPDDADRQSYRAPGQPEEEPLCGRGHPLEEKGVSRLLLQRVQRLHLCVGQQVVLQQALVEVQFLQQLQEGRVALLLRSLESDGKLPRQVEDLGDRQLDAARLVEAPHVVDVLQGLPVGRVDRHAAHGLFDLLHELRRRLVLVLLEQLRQLRRHLHRLAELDVRTRAEAVPVVVRQTHRDDVHGVDALCLRTQREAGHSVLHRKQRRAVVRPALREDADYAVRVERVEDVLEHDVVVDLRKHLEHALPVEVEVLLRLHVQLRVADDGRHLHRIRLLAIGVLHRDHVACHHLFCEQRPLPNDPSVLAGRQ